MKTRTLDINGHIVESVNVCTVQHREPDPVKPREGAKPRIERNINTKLTMECEAMLKNWGQARIRQYLRGISEADSAKYAAELNRIVSKSKQK